MVPHQGSGVECTCKKLFHLCIDIVPYLLVCGLGDSVGALVVVVVVVVDVVVVVVGRGRVVDLVVGAIVFS